MEHIALVRFAPGTHCTPTYIGWRTAEIAWNFHVIFSRHEFTTQAGVPPGFSHHEYVSRFGWGASPLHERILAFGERLRFPQRASILAS